ncbi:MAG: MFS transporter [Janthinobacterium lividum]
MLTILTTVYAVSFIDRQVINLLVGPIRHSLVLSDLKMSLLQGLAFTIAYILFSPVFGRLADRWNRRNILIGGLAFWSACTIVCGWSSSYWVLFLSRIGIGAAEACVTPASWSILSDYFDRQRLPRAMSIFLIGSQIGSGLALIFGGLLLQAASTEITIRPALVGFQPWQLVFISLGLPGLLLALVLLVVREPARSDASGLAAAPPALATVDALRFFWDGRAFFVRFYLAMASIIMILYAMPAWMPTFLVRRHGAQLTSLGLHYGILSLVAGIAGVLSGPAVGRWVARRGHTGSTMIVVVMSAVALIPTCLVLPFVPGYRGALAVAAVATVLFSLPQAMAVSALQLATPAGMRGLAASMYVLVVSITGLGLAPTLVALLTDRVFHEPNQIGASLGIVCVLSAILAAVLARGALPHYRLLIART